MKILIMLLVCLLPQPGLAEFRERELHPPRCDHNVVNACIASERAAATFKRNQLVNLEPTVVALRAKLEEYGKNLSHLGKEKGAFLIEQSMLGAELEFLRAPAPVKGGDVIASLSLEDFVRMPLLHRSWRERYPEERAERLSALVDDNAKRESDLSVRIAQIEADWRKVNNEFQSALARKNTWLDEIRSHDAMCSSGCREQLCPSGN